MKTILIFLLIITATIKLSAEEINYTVKSTEVLRDKLMVRSAGLKAIGSVNDHAFMLYQPFTAIYSGATIGGGKMKHYIGKFDKDVNLVKKTALILDQNGKKVDFEGVQIIKNKIFVFFSFQNVAKKKHYLFSRSVNAETLELEDDTKMIAELDYTGISKYKRTSVQYEISEDESKIMLFYTVLNNKNEPLRFAVHVYDNELNSIWNTNVSPKFETGVFSYKQIRVDNNGDVYLLGAHYADMKNYFNSAKFSDNDFFSKDTYFTDVPNFTYQIYRYFNNGTKEEYKDITLDSKFIRSMNFTVLDGKASVNGIFSNPQTISARGAFSFKLNVANGQKTDVSTEIFSTELIEKGFTEKELNRFKRSIKDKSEYDPFDYIISDVKTLSDGTKYYTAEQFINGTKKERNGNQIVYTPIYLYNDVFIIRLNAKNSIESIEKISKRQYALTTSRYNSFIDFEKDGNLYFIYNTIKKKDTMFKNAEIGDTYISKITKNSNIEKVYNTPESKKAPLIMPVTKVEFPNHSILYGMMSSNFKDYKFELIKVE
jgi:hypothetical protein